MDTDTGIGTSMDTDIGTNMDSDTGISMDMDTGTGTSSPTWKPGTGTHTEGHDKKSFDILHTVAGVWCGGGHPPRH